MLVFDQLPAGTNSAKVSSRELVCHRERVVDEREQKDEVESLRIGDGVDADRQRLAHDRAEQ